jgi:hypothetical protein
MRVQAVVRTAGSFTGVARPEHWLEILDVVPSALGYRDDMVGCHLPAPTATDAPIIEPDA